jgi:hypothetical protein
VSNDTISSSGVKRNSHLSEKPQTHKAVELPVLLPVSGLVRLALTLPKEHKNNFSIKQTAETLFTKDTEKKNRFQNGISRSIKREVGDIYKGILYVLLLDIKLSTQNGKV